VGEEFSTNIKEITFLHLLLKKGTEEHFTV
jgi:hypothetical protein